MIRKLKQYKYSLFHCKINTRLNQSLTNTHPFLMSVKSLHLKCKKCVKQNSKYAGSKEYVFSKRHKHRGFIIKKYYLHR